jgi:hypothetical protein
MAPGAKRRSIIFLGRNSRKTGSYVDIVFFFNLSFAATNGLGITAPAPAGEAFLSLPPLQIDPMDARGSWIKEDHIVELWRRVIMLFGIMGAVALFMWVSLKPVFQVQAVDFAEEQKDQSQWTERGQYLAQLPLESFISEITKDKSLPVEGPAWEAFFDGVEAAGTGRPGTPKDWLRRIPGYQRDWGFTSRVVYFRRNESTLDQIASHFGYDLEQSYLILSREGKKDYLELTYRVYDHGDFLLGSGFNSSKPPTFIFHPLRPLSMIPLLAGLAFYIFWPAPKREEKAVFYPRWRLVVGDFLTLLMTVPFFILPILISGGTLQAFTTGIFLLPVMFLMFGLGLWILWLMGWFGSFSLLIHPDRLDLQTIDGRESLPFDRISYYQPLVAKPPKWLVILSWVGALAGRGSAGTGALGRAMILSGTAYHGLNIGLKDGTTRYLWISDQMGSQALKRAENIPSAMEKAGIPMKKKPKIIISIGMRYGEGRKKSSLQSRRKRMFVLVWVIPLLLLAAAAWLESTSYPHIPSQKDAVKESVEETPTVPNAEVVWEQDFGGQGGGGLSIGVAVSGTVDGGYLAAGHSNDFKTDMASDLDFYVIRTDGSGTPLWERTYGTELPDRLKSVCPTSDGGWLLIGESERMAAQLLDESSDIYLVRIDRNGEKLWDRVYESQTAFERVFAARETAGGGFELPVVTDGVFSIVRIDRDGEKTGETERVTVYSGGNSETFWIAPISGGGYILTGEVMNAGIGFKELMLVRFDAGGSKVWERIFGGPRKESGSFVVKLREGGFAAVGVTESAQDENGDLYIVRTDEPGESVWSLSCGTAAVESGLHILEKEDGGLLALGESKMVGQAGSGIYLAGIDADGSLEWEKIFRQSGFEYLPSSILEMDDGLVVCGTRSRGDFELRLSLVKIR